MPRETKSWSESWMEQAFRFADDRSKDPNTQVGCVIVSPDKIPLVSGYNGLPQRVADLDYRYAREPLTPTGRRPKDLWVRHAEENAVSNAARIGARLAGATAYVTHHPCSRCAGALINAGIVAVVIGDGKTAMPAEEFDVARGMFREAGVQVSHMRCDPVTGATTVRQDFASRLVLPEDIDAQQLAENLR